MYVDFFSHGSTVIFFFLIQSSNYIYQPRGYAMLLIRTSIFF